MKKALGILLVITGFTFLIWFFLSVPASFMTRILVNIAAFFVIALGYAMLRTKPGEKVNDFMANMAVKEKKFEKTVEKPPPVRDPEKEDPERFMPN